MGECEEALRVKVDVFLRKGEMQPSHVPWVVRGFLKSKTNANWRLAIDYQYVNTQLHGHEFPPPVIGDMLLRQQANHLWSLPALEDGFYQIRLSEGSRQYTAFCTPWGVFEWKILPISIKVGSQALQGMVSDCSKHLHPGTMPYIDNLLSGLGLFINLKAES